MRLLPLTPAASRCARSDPEVQPEPPLDLDEDSPHPVELPLSLVGHPGEPEPGYFTSASFSRQTVSRFSIAHITRTR